MADSLLALFKQSIEEILTDSSRPMRLDVAQPTIVLVVGVNGTGKTDDHRQDRQAPFGAADARSCSWRPIRSALRRPSSLRSGPSVPRSCIVRREEGADPASVVYEGARRPWRKTRPT